MVCFGNVYHRLDDMAYEYDFGLRVTLNCVDPKKLKSTDALDVSAARRQRTQIPVESDLTYFDFDRDSNIIKSLTGKVKKEYEKFFKHATGASNLKISSDMQPNEIITTCEKLLSLYESEDFKDNFPNVQNISPVKDPVVIEQLDKKMLDAFKNKDIDLCLMVPDIVNYQDNVYSQFSGAGRGLRYEDIDMQNYYQYLEDRGVDCNSMGVDALKKYKLVLANEDGSPRDTYNLYRSFVFDTDLNGGTETYHLCEGSWYKVENDYMIRIQSFLDPCYEDQNLIPYNHETEGKYNLAAAAADQELVCLDTKNISPAGQYSVEPCDIYTISGDKGTFYHVKVSTRSAHLSHLFLQGQNSMELLKSEEESCENLRELLRKEVSDGDQGRFLAPVGKGPYKVIYAIITKKDKSKKSKNLPLFSRISLMRSIKSLKLMGVDVGYCFIEDQVAKKAGQKKPKKKRKKKNVGRTPDSTGVQIEVPTNAANTDSPHAADAEAKS